MAINVNVLPIKSVEYTIQSINTRETVCENVKKLLSVEVLDTDNSSYWFWCYDGISQSTITYILCQNTNDYHDYKKDRLQIYNKSNDNIGRTLRFTYIEAQ